MWRTRLSGLPWREVSLTLLPQGCVKEAVWNALSLAVGLCPGAVFREKCAGALRDPWRPSRDPKRWRVGIATAARAHDLWSPSYGTAFGWGCPALLSGLLRKAAVPV